MNITNTPNWREFLKIAGEQRFKENHEIQIQTPDVKSLISKLYTEVEKTDDLIRIARLGMTYHVPVYIIGSGSFIRTRNSMINGLVIRNNCRRFEIFSPASEVSTAKNSPNHTVYAEAGTLLSQLVRFTIDKSLSGLEYLIGLPGTVGGAIYSNARHTPNNIYINDIISSVKILDELGNLKQVHPHSLIQLSTEQFSPAKFIIISAMFSLHPGDKQNLWDNAQSALEYREKLNEKDRYMNK